MVVGDVYKAWWFLQLTPTNQRNNSFSSHTSLQLKNRMDTFYTFFTTNSHPDQSPDVPTNWDDGDGGNQWCVVA
jgi:hypothetical protein